MVIVGSIIIIILGIVGWYVLWYLIQDPEAPFQFTGTTLHHAQNPDELLIKVKAFVYQVEVVFVEDIMALLHISNIEAEIYLDYMVETDELVKYDNGEYTFYTLT